MSTVAIGKDMNSAPTRISELLAFGAICAQLGVIVVVMRQFQIENSAFREVALLAFAGFVVHYFLPQKLRMGFFALLSIGTLVLVFGPANGAWMVGFGLVLLGICHLPLSLWLRCALLVAVGGLAAAAKVELIPGPWSQAIWPILASMFMFRLVVYLYDLRNEKTTLACSLSYFFMLPNVCFPMFPVVDFKGMRRTYYNAEQHRIYQTGVDWMVRGMIQLIIYRVIYYYTTLSPTEVIDPDTLTQYIVTNFLLYLRISGDFHLITGMLHLFGFNLVPTHHLYCLASSFTDLWRRINIYWKDFMMKIFYYPTLFRLRKYGDLPAIVVATIVVFFGTWALHSYQWFWLRGEFPIIWQDIVFWSALALLVVVGSIKEYKSKGSARTLGTRKESLRATINRGLRTVGVFFFLCILWSIWSAESVGSWTTMWSFLWEGIPDGGSAVPLLFLVVAAVIFFSGIIFGRESSVEKRFKIGRNTTIGRSTVETLATLAIIAPLGLPQVYTALGTNVANVIISLKSGGLSRADAAAMERGYYEDLTRVNRFNSQLWEIYMNRPAGGLLGPGGGNLTRLRDDFLQTEMVPNMRSNTEHGVIQTNRWGMRDKNYALTPAPGTTRGVILGYSTVMGWGVRDGETFEALLEKRINEALANQPNRRFELLNVAVQGYRPPQLVMSLQESLKFSPGIAIYMAAGREQWNTVNFLAETIENGVKIPYPKLNALIEKAGVTPDMDRPEITKRLLLHQDELLAWVYDTFVSICAQHNIRPIWIYLPPLFPTAGEPAARAGSRAAAQKAGFEMIDLSHSFDGMDPNTLIVAQWDRHPNAKAHKHIADAIFEAMQAKPQAFGLPRW